MEEKFREFLKIGRELSENWDNEKIKNYPSYLPSFDEFLSDFELLFEEPEPKKIVVELEPDEFDELEWNIDREMEDCDKEGNLEHYQLLERTKKSLEKKKIVF